MDCNKDEAIKAKELAEKKLESKDYNAARKFALKSQSLFPGLDGLPHLLTTLNIYASIERKINGEVDWYGVLGVDPSSDDETVKKQYRKLALILHPDKNKSAGAEGAFKILSEAWSLLSDRSKRSVYDLKRTSSRGIFEKVIPTHPSKSAGVGSVYASAKNGNFNGSSMNAPNPHLVPPQRQNTFWTVCTSCKMQFEYIVFYLNKKLECYSCKQHFLAIPISPPQTNFHTSGMTFVPNGQTGTAVVGNVSAVNGGQLPRKNLKRTQENAQGEKPRKRRRASGTAKSGGLSVGDEAFGVRTLSGAQRFSADMEKKETAGGTKWRAATRELTLRETHNMLIEKAKKEICKKLDERKNLAAKAKCFKTLSYADTNEVQTSGDNPVANTRGASEDRKLETSSSAASGVSEAKAAELAALSMTVPDSDFHDFDNDRTVNSFGDNQVWAAYDNDDGMPRYYAMIHNVISRKPFKMRISWLNSKSTAEFGTMNWVGSGFYKTSGDFRVGKHELNKTVNAFSHRVKWTKGARGAIRIYPSKGDIWALYKNWSSEWNEHTPDKDIHQYDMVEVVTDYDEEKGVIVIPLVKVSGFKTVFRQHTDQKQVKVIPREEIFRFSHQVPSYLLTGRESSGAPKGCLELDPAATPMELLQVMTEAKLHEEKDCNENGTRSGGSNSEMPKSKEPARTDIAKDEARLMDDDIRVQVNTVIVG